jgi:LPS export ABC transporter protein LptC
MNKFNSGFLFSILFCLFCASSCTNDIETINNVVISDTLPVETAKDIEVIYSDSGNVQIWLKGPVYKRYTGKENTMVFPEGIEVIFYDPGMVVKSTLTAKYAIIYENKKLMEARNDVVVKSVEKSESLQTEKLSWDERSKRIFSNEFVRITTKDKVLFGQGFESDQQFNNWTIQRPTGSIAVNNDQ